MKRIFALIALVSLLLLPPNETFADPIPDFTPCRPYLAPNFVADLKTQITQAGLDTGVDSNVFSKNWGFVIFNSGGGNNGVGAGQYTVYAYPWKLENQSKPNYTTLSFYPTTDQQLVIALQRVVGSSTYAGLLQSDGRVSGVQRASTALSETQLGNASCVTSNGRHFGDSKARFAISNDLGAQSDIGIWGVKVPAATATQPTQSAGLTATELYGVLARFVAVGVVFWLLIKIAGMFRWRWR